MDIKKSPSKNSNNHKSIIIFVITIVAIVLTIWSLSQPSALEKVAKSQIWTATVQQGELSLEVEGYGKLKSKEQRLLTAPANATVEEIFLKPGSLVTKNSVIARLANPVISQKVKEAKHQLNFTQTAYLQLELNQQRKLLAHQAQQEQLLSELEIAKLKMQAEEKLVKRGIVSELTFKRSQLDYRQLSRRITIEKKRLIQLNNIYEKELSIAQDRIEQQQEQLNVINEQFNRLTVTAGINGVVQSLPVELGQSVALGEQIALVGSVDSLYALLNVSQSDMDLIATEQMVNIDTRGGIISGTVQRINPLVQQGMITIEITITSELPKNARPDLNIDGVISTGKIENTLFVKKPVNANSGMKSKLFKLNSDKSTAKPITVTYGHESGEFIQLVSNETSALTGNAIQANDIVILSDMSRWNESTQITIVQ